MVFVKKGAKRQPCISQKSAKGNSFAQRPISPVGGVFRQKIASPEALPSPEKGPGRKPSHANGDLFLSFGSGFPESSGALAPVSLPFPREMPQAGVGSSVTSFAHAKDVTDDGLLSHGPEGRLGKFSINSTTSSQESLVTPGFHEEKDSKTHRSKMNLDRRTLRDHFQKREWAKRCRIHFHSVAESLQFSIDTLPTRILETSEAINKERAELRRLKADQGRLPGIPISSKERCARDRYNSLVRLRRELMAMLATSKKQLKRVSQYLDILGHSVFSCRDYVIPHSSRRMRKDGTLAMWNTSSPGVPEVHVYSESMCKLDMDGWAGEGDIAVKTKFLRLCLSAFFCANCSTIINTQRRKGLEALMEWVRQEGLIMSFVTLTVPHRYDDDIVDLVDKLLLAQKKLREGNEWECFAKRTGLIGVVRVLEVTDGDASGFHPHLHFLFLYGDPELHKKLKDKEQDGADDMDINAARSSLLAVLKNVVAKKDRPAWTVDAVGVETWLQKSWTKHCGSVGLVKSVAKRKAHLTYGCKVNTGTDFDKSSYMTKLAPLEFAEPGTKKGRNASRRTHWELFVLAYAEKTPGRYSRRYLDLMIALKCRRSFSVSPELAKHMIVEEEETLVADTYLFHLEPRVRQHNREGIFIPGLTGTENLPKLQDHAADDVWEHLKRCGVGERSEREPGDRKRIGGAGYWLPVKQRPWIFQRTSAFSASEGTRMSFERIQVMQDRVKLPTGEVITIWRVVTNDLDVLVEAGLQGVGWFPIPDIVPKRDSAVRTHPAGEIPPYPQLQCLLKTG